MPRIFLLKNSTSNRSTRAVHYKPTGDVRRCFTRPSGRGNEPKTPSVGKQSPLGQECDICLLAFWCAHGTLRGMRKRSSIANSTPDQAGQTVDGKNPAAVALGRMGGLKGGPARAEKLSARARSSIARKAALARWEKPE
jgi:hypothetical protein